MAVIETPKSAVTNWRYLRPEDVARLKSYEFAPRLLVEGYLAGRHRSPERGHSVEFKDYRGYSPGDDLRSIDWKALARSERYYVRLYEEETDMVVHLFLDSSASMGYGDRPSKLEYSSFFTAALSHLVVRQNDMVSLTLFDNGVRTHIPPGSTRHHMSQIMHVLERNSAGQKTRLSEALRRGFPLLRKRGIVVIVSDFLDSTPDIFSALNMYLHRGHEVVLFHVLNPREIDLAGHGPVRFRDMESSEEVEADPSVIRARYRERVNAFLRNMRASATRKGIEYIFARTDTHYFRLFDHYLKRKMTV